MENVIYFPCDLCASYNTETEKINKIFTGYKGWQNLEATVIDLQKPNRAIQTGRRSNITVIDFDYLPTYERMIKEIPELKDVYHVKTRKGYHLYFQYDERLKSGADCFTIKGVDIRNDGGCIIASPSSYSCKGEIFRYEELGGSITRIPDALLAYVKKDKWKIEEVVENTVVTPVPVPVIEFAQLVALLSVNRAEGYEDWSKVGFGIKNVLGEEGLEVFLAFSKQSSKFVTKDCIAYWQSIKIRKTGNKITEKTFHFWAKEDNPEGYALLYPPQTDQYLIQKEKFEENHFFCEEPEPCFVRYYDVPQENGRNLIRYSDKALRLLLKPVKIASTDKNGKPYEKSFYDLWTEDAKKRTYKRIGFYPDETKCPEDEFNSYLPATASFLSTMDNIDITPIIKHFDVMADDDEQVAKFLIKFFAQIVQQPDKLPGIAVLLIAQEGAGKDVVTDWIGKYVLGSHQSIKPGKLENMMKNFNSHMSGRFLVHSDECEEATMRKYNEDLKRLITNHAQFVEKKGIDGGVENNYARIWMTVNPPEVMRYISPTDRRFIVTRSSSKYCGNDEYFISLRHCMAQPGVARAFYDYLMEYDISDFTQAQRPITTLTAELRENNIPPILQWIKDIDKIETPQQKTTEWMTEYNRWAGHNNMKIYSVTTFGLAVNDLIAKQCGITKQTPKNVRKMTINKEEVEAWLKKNGFWNEEEE